MGINFELFFTMIIICTLYDDHSGSVAHLLLRCQSLW